MEEIDTDVINYKHIYHLIYYFVGTHFVHLSTLDQIPFNILIFLLIFKFKSFVKLCFGYLCFTIHQEQHVTLKRV